VKLGFIGCGNMASALIEGILKNGLLLPEEIAAADLNTEALRRSAEKFGIKTFASNIEIAEAADYLLLAVKPQFYENVISEIRENFPEKSVIISIAAGKTLAWLEKKFGRRIRAVRAMPNTPALVGEGMTGLCCGGPVSRSELDFVKSLFSACGKAEELPESLIDTVTAVSGSSPAYVFIFIEAMADAAVAGGMPRAQAYTFAAQAVLGSAKMLLETGRHPAELKDMVCSPAGATIAAVRVLEEKGLRSAVFEAMEACRRRAGEL
jgi:pyrroline-5-carboxylate reductase